MTHKKASGWIPRTEAQGCHNQRTANKRRVSSWWFTSLLHWQDEIFFGLCVHSSSFLSTTFLENWSRPQQETMWSLRCFILTLTESIKSQLKLLANISALSSCPLQPSECSDWSWRTFFITAAVCMALLVSEKQEIQSVHSRFWWRILRAGRNKLGKCYHQQRWWTSPQRHRGGGAEESRESDCDQQNIIKSNPDFINFESKMKNNSTLKL